MRFRAILTLVPFLALLACSAADDDATPEQSKPVIQRAPGIYEAVIPPYGARNPPWLAQRQREQIEAAKALGIFTDFSFADRRRESSITFIHRIVDDAGKHYKAVHYDHGNGIAAADVDGDGLLDLYFVTQLGSNELWRNLGGGRFENATTAAGVGVAGRVSVAAAFGDLDNDGDPDLYVTTVRDGNLLFENVGGGRFQDITASSGLGYAGHSSGAIFFDYDRDGLLDVFLANVGTYTVNERGRGGYWVGVAEGAFAGHLLPERAEKSRLFRNLGGNRFEDVTERTGLVDESWSGDASAADLTGDGWPDLYLLNMQGLDQFWENQGGKRFVRRTEKFFPRTSWGSMGIKVFDFENDGDLDIYITDMHSDMAQAMTPDNEYVKNPMPWPSDFRVDGGNGIYGNSFFRNEGKGNFVEVSDAIGAENYWPWGLSVGDLNADGFEDAFITASMNYPWRYGANSIKLNDRGRRFVDTEGVQGVEPRPDGRSVVRWFEGDCSGADKQHDICASTGVDSGTVEVWGAIGTRSSVILDLEGDGDLDIVTNDFGSEPMVLVSDLTERRNAHFLKVDLKGARSNRDGIGALVTLRAGDRTLTQLHDGKSGYLSQSAMPLYFGLDDIDRVNEIRVQWPSGNVQIIHGPIDVNRKMVISETDR